MQEIPDTRIMFDGRMEAKKIEESLKISGKLEGKGLLILQCDGSSTESIYIRLKRQMAERLGVETRVLFVWEKDIVMKEIEKGNEDNSIDGILVQLPIKGANREEIEQILSTINPVKDIDGLNPKSSFVPAAVVAVETVMEKINLSRDLAVAIVGAEGMVGKALYGRLSELGYVVSGFDMGDDLMKLNDFDVVVSCTGQEGLITGDMVKQGFVGIDLGFPQGDISEEAGGKARVITPVPGGVGPLTIVSLFVSMAA